MLSSEFIYLFVDFCLLLLLEFAPRLILCLSYLPLFYHNFSLRVETWFICDYTGNIPTKTYTNICIERQNIYTHMYASFFSTKYYRGFSQVLAYTVEILELRLNSPSGFQVVQISMARRRKRLNTVF